jgi:hypothetical protein
VAVQNFEKEMDSLTEPVLLHEARVYQEGMRSRICNSLVGKN